MDARMPCWASGPCNPPPRTRASLRAATAPPTAKRPTALARTQGVCRNAPTRLPSTVVLNTARGTFAVPTPLPRWCGQASRSPPLWAPHLSPSRPHTCANTPASTPRRRHGIQIHQLRQLPACVLLYRLRPHLELGLCPHLSLQPPCTRYIHCTLLACPDQPADYLGPNHAPGAPPAIHVRDLRLSVITALGVDFVGRRCLDVGCNDGSISTQIGALPLVQRPSRLYAFPADSMQTSLRPRSERRRGRRY